MAQPQNPFSQSIILALFWPPQAVKPKPHKPEPSLRPKNGTETIAVAEALRLVAVPLLLLLVVAVVVTVSEVVFL